MAMAIGDGKVEMAAVVAFEMVAYAVVQEGSLGEAPEGAAAMIRVS